MDQEPTTINSIEKRKRRRRRLTDSSSSKGRALNSNSLNDIAISSIGSNASSQRSNQGSDIGIPRFPTGILGGRGGGGGGAAAVSTSWLLSGPWLELSSRLNLPIPNLSGLERKDYYDCRGTGGNGKINKGTSPQLAEKWKQIYSSAAQCTVSDVEMGMWDLRVPFIAGVLRKIRKPREKDLVAQLVDPTGSVECFFQEAALAKYGADIGVGTAVLAKGVAVWLSHTTGLCRNLCLHPDTIKIVLPPDTPRPGEEKLNRIQGLSEDIPIEDVIHNHSSELTNDVDIATTTTSRVNKARDGEGIEAAGASFVNDGELLLSHPRSSRDETSVRTAAAPVESTPQLETFEEEDFFTAEEFKENKPLRNVLYQQPLLPPPYVEQNAPRPSKINAYPPYPATLVDPYVKHEEQNHKSIYYPPVDGGGGPPFNCSVTSSSTPDHPSHPPSCPVGSSSSAPSQLHCEGSKSNTTTRYDVVETTTLIQKEEGIVLQNGISMLEKSKVTKAASTTADVEAVPPMDTGVNGSIASFGSDSRSLKNSVQKQQHGPPASSTGGWGWGETLNEQDMLESLLDDGDDD